MAAALKLVAPASHNALENIVINWADNSAEMAQVLRRELDSGKTPAGIACSVLPQLRAIMTGLEQLAAMTAAK